GKPPVAEELYARLRAAERVASMQRELLRLATTDPLTGVLNRRAFFEQAGQACARAAAGRDVAVVLFDIDHFKRINDIYGHDVGDKAIRAVAMEAGNEGAVVGRLGGEEFALVLEDHRLDQAIEVAERLRRAVGALKFEMGRGATTLTCSFGVGAWEQG